MSIWDTLGLSAQQGLLAVAASLATACLLAARVILRRSRAEQKSALGLHDRKGDR
jgi:hypothetical protein